jgi:4-aminobutyrate aminotransferase
VNSKEVRQKQKELLFPCVASYYEEPVVLTRAQGTRAFDLEGCEYIDCFGGILTISLGHCHPEVVDAVSAQLARLGHTSTLYPTENQVMAAQTLARLTPGKLAKSFFTSSGTEADETAVMLAKIYTGRHEIIALRHAYSGRSHLALGMCGNSSYRVISSSIPGIVHAPAPYCYRCPFGLSYPSCEVKCARDLEELIQTTTTGRPAAFLAEPIQGVGGFIVPPPEYFQIAVGIVRKHGGVFICDEVQTGFGRTGGKWFGIEHWGVEPDIMTMAKGIANGFPAAATIATAEVADAWTGGSIATFGGNSVAMAAVNATVAVMERERVPALAAERGAELTAALQGFKERYRFIGDVRGMGLMQAIELCEDRATKEPSPRITAAVLEAAKRRGVLLGKGGTYGNVIRFAPPMLISRAELADAIERMGQAFSEVKT